MTTAKRILRTAFQFAGAGLLLWSTAMFCSYLGTNRATAAMMLLLEVLGIAALGDWVLALMSSSLASLAFSYYFIDEIGSFRFTTLQGFLTFGALASTAIIGSRLAILAQRRAKEAVQRREEVERLNHFGRALLSANTLGEASEDAVRKVVELFDLKGAVLRVAGAPRAFQWGVTAADQVSIIPLGTDYSADVLELHGIQPSEEIRNTVASMIRLVLERARGAEERTQMEAIRRGEEFRTTVLNALAHNFKTPLTSIKAAASMLRVSDRISSAHDRELVAAIDEEADRLNQLIKESLDLAKLEARQTHPLAEECVIPQIVGRVAKRLSRYLGGREFIIDIPEDLPSMTGDSFLLEQMLVQVVDNAWKYSQPGAPIRISGVVSGSSVILTVWNAGSEIPADERDRIFDRFYRGSKDRHRVEGTGLGLAIARTIAEACRGRIWLDAEPLGPAFRLELPLEVPVRKTGRQGDRESNYFTH
ncbi:MAG TPA: ATP-binding protein [Bryobacteraceae bacterium]|jgi:two-component system sensor histidine kinase KdpD